MSYITSKLRNACILTLVAGQVLAETAVNATKAETTPLEKNLVVGYFGVVVAVSCFAAGLLGVGIYNKCRYGSCGLWDRPFRGSRMNNSSPPAEEQQNESKPKVEKTVLSSSNQKNYQTLGSVKLDILEVRQPSR